jgi:DNA polymerase III alpha subunit
MITDKYGQQVYDEQDLCNLYLSDPNIRLKNVLVSDPISFDPNLNLDHIPKIIQYTVSDQTIDDFDSSNRQNWFIPDAYKDFDIAKFVLEQCASEPELQRAGEELILYQDRNMFMLLRYLKYLVDTMRSNKVVWGVGRGSSVSSFVLYLIGVHKINSLYYDLSITEFLK